jgi:DNA-binding protein HU-beta
VTKSDFIKSLKEKADIESLAKADKAYGAVFDIISESLKAGENVAITGFGTFKIVERAARKGRNPRTQKPLDIPASKTVKFSVGKALKEQL